MNNAIKLVDSFYKLMNLLGGNLWFQAATMANVNGEDRFHVYTNAKEKQFDTFTFDGIKVIEFLVPKGALDDN